MYRLGFVKYDCQLIKKAGIQLCVKIFSRAKLTKLEMSEKNVENSRCIYSQVHIFCNK